MPDAMGGTLQQFLQRRAMEPRMDDLALPRMPTSIPRLGRGTAAPMGPAAPPNLPQILELLAAMGGGGTPGVGQPSAAQTFAPLNSGTGVPSLASILALLGGSKGGILYGQPVPARPPQYRPGMAMAGGGGPF